ncbi:unnamed protein product, partial [Mesorhabditis belari]|uniref:Cysteine protease n=1 Tax=Mesorhabditis belari TaxID=2138241 RepID=A0AAF3ECM1_9BILA
MLLCTTSSRSIWPSASALTSVVSLQRSLHDRSSVPRVVDDHEKSRWKVKDVGYNFRYHQNGIEQLPRIPGCRVPVQRPHYKERDTWRESQARFGQNDYIDLLGDGSIHPAQLQYHVPVWLRGFPGQHRANELVKLIHYRNLYKEKLQNNSPRRWHDLQKRIKYLLMYHNYNKQDEIRNERDLGLWDEKPDYFYKDKSRRSYEDLVVRVVDVGMDMLESYVTFETPFQELQNYALIATEGGLDILGKHFTADSEIETIREYITSRLWFTYRRGFHPIGGTGPASDQGWGCMLRCAQMLLGEVLLRRHIGLHYNWKREKPSGNYEKILRMFLDTKNSLYSIHLIAQMGVSEGKKVGEWFGPNTAAQVLKKLCVFDTWSDVAVHVALDNIVVREDVELMATTMPSDDAVKLIREDGKLDHSLIPSSLSSGDFEREADNWRSLLLIVPLRLGLTTINRCYLPAIQEYFRLPQCTGIIGGRPNHALYFIGITGEKLLYLDPHFCQQSLVGPRYIKPESFVDGFESINATQEDNADLKEIDDTTYHCPTVLGMAYDQVDPSLALTFFCRSRDEFEDLSRRLKETLLTASSPPLFEQLQHRPSYWPKFEPYIGVKAKIEMKEFHDMGDPNYDSDDQFEVLE